MELEKLYPGKELSLKEVAAMLRQAIQRERPFSLIRLGDGEMRALGYNIFKPLKDMTFQFDYAGVALPNETTRQELLQGIKEADIIGLLPPHKAAFLPQVIQHFRIQPRYICYFTINWELHGRGDGPLYDLLSDRRVYLVNRHAKEALKPLESLGVNITGYTSFEGYSDIERVFARLEKDRKNFDILLASAGIPAIRLCPMVAKSLKKVAIDYGHVVEKVIDPTFGRATLAALKDRWRKEEKRPLQDGSLVQGNSDHVYRIEEGKKRHITSAELFNKLGYKREDIVSVPTMELSFYPEGDPIRE